MQTVHKAHIIDFTMRVLAVDPGEKNIGIAISDAQGVLARPLKIIKHVSREKDAEQIVRLAVEQQCELMVVGQALDGDGQVGSKARAAQKLAGVLRQMTELPIQLWDESNSSIRIHEIDLQVGRSRKKRKALIDDRAAALLLDDFLSSTEFSMKKEGDNDKKTEAE